MYCVEAKVAVLHVRLSSHELRIETGRWARIPRERRLCPCGEIQDEKHVIVDCPITQAIRDNYDMDMTTFTDIINLDSVHSFKMIHEMLELLRTFRPE